MNPHLDRIPTLDDPKNPDMSSEAIDRRIRKVSQLRKLGLSMRDAKFIGPAPNRPQVVQDHPAEPT